MQSEFFNEATFDAVFYSMFAKYGVLGLEKNGDRAKTNEEYREASSLYSSSLFNIHKSMKQVRGAYDAFRCTFSDHFDFRNMTKKQLESYVMMMAMRKKMASLLLKRAQCLWKLRIYDDCMRDLNQTIAISTIKIDRIEDQKRDYYLHMLHAATTATWLRTQLWLKLGNSAMALCDIRNASHAYPHDEQGKLVKLDPNVMAISHKLTEQLITLSTEKGIEKHPCELSIAKCNKFTRRLCKFSSEGWKQLMPSSIDQALPKKYAHVMIAHQSSVYVFGGTCLEFHEEGRSSNHIQLEMDAKFSFFCIDVNVKDLSYKFRSLPLPERIEDSLSAATGCVELGRVISGHKWRNHLVIFGGYSEPFVNIFLYCLNKQEWRRCVIRHAPKILKVCSFMTHHASVILNDTLYVFGGSLDWSDETNIFCGLDLQTKRWTVLTAHDASNIDTNGKTSIPGSRHEHAIWKDSESGEKGSIFVAYGSHIRKEKAKQPLPGIRTDIWRYDVAKMRWFSCKRHGNHPCERSECGFTHTQNNVILFGGYCDTLTQPRFGLDFSTAVKSVDASNCGLWMNQFVFFGDCFEYLSKHRKWVMIHSKIFPKHRALPALCVVDKTKLLLYGGYHGGAADETVVYNDLWILDLKSLKSKKWKTRVFKICASPKCKSQQSENDVKLYKCNGEDMMLDIFGKAQCETYYCSKRCQKRDWIVHRASCKRSF